MAVRLNCEMAKPPTQVTSQLEVNMTKWSDQRLRAWREVKATSAAPGENAWG